MKTSKFIKIYDINRKIEAMQEFVMTQLEQINYQEGMSKISHDIFAEYYSYLK